MFLVQTDHGAAAISGTFRAPDQSGPAELPHQGAGGGQPVAQTSRELRDTERSGEGDHQQRLFATAAASYAASHAHVAGLAGAATIHGYTTAFWWAAGIFGLGLLVALVVLPAKIELRTPSAEVSLATE